MHAIPNEVRYVMPILSAGVAGYVIARIAMLIEPHTLRRYPAGSLRAHVGEAIIVSLAVTMAQVLLGEEGVLPFGLGAGIAIVIGYLIFHAAVLPFLFMWRAGKVAGSPRREPLRRFIQVAAFVAEGTVVAAMMALTANAHQEIRQGPWGWLDVLFLPWLSIIVLIFCYPPIAALEVAASRRGETRGEALHEVFEAMVVIVAALYVVAITGAAPWI
jgi:hypothetical protein